MRCQKLQQVYEVQSFSHDTDPQLIIVLSLVYCCVDKRCSKSGQKFSYLMCRVASVVMKTTQLVLNQFKNLTTSVEN